MSMMSKDEAKALMEKAIKLSKADECQVNLNGTTSGNVRYALNTVTTSGSTTNVQMVIQSAFGKKSGTTTLNQFDDASIERAVRASEELAKLAPDNPEYMPILGPQEYSEGKTYVQATADISPEYRAKAAADSIVPSREKELTAAGFFNDSHGFAAMANSKGLFAYNKSSNVSFSSTIRTADGKGSGWVTRDYNDVRKLDTGRASAIAIDKAVRSAEARAIEPGKYTVILEPAASVQLIANMAGAFDLRLVDEGRSFLSARGEDPSKIGTKVFDERVNIYSDPLNDEVPTAPWSGDGQPYKKTVWIEDGVVKNVGVSRFWAEQQGVQPLPAPNNFVMEGGDASLEDLIKQVRRGILVTRTWYIRTVDPQTQLYTGLTRDGTFFVENGEIKYPVKNLRFNESPIVMLNNIEALGKPQRINGNLVPPMIVRDFEFTSLSDAV